MLFCAQNFLRILPEEECFSCIQDDWIRQSLIFSAIICSCMQESVQAHSSAHNAYSDAYSEMDDASIVKLTQFVDLQDSRNMHDSVRSNKSAKSNNSLDDPLSRLHRCPSYFSTVHSSCYALAIWLACNDHSSDLPLSRQAFSRFDVNLCLRLRPSVLDSCDSVFYRCAPFCFQAVGGSRIIADLSALYVGQPWCAGFGRAHQRFA